jgi:hypothetical protein
VCPEVRVDTTDDLSEILTQASIAAVQQHGKFIFL